MSSCRSHLEVKKIQERSSEFCKQVGTLDIIHVSAIDDGLTENLTTDHFVHKTNCIQSGLTYTQKDKAIMEDLLDLHRSTAIVGLGYGDEGKGMTVGFISEKIRRQGGQPVVVRYNGGPQAAHNVRLNGRHHTFSQLGAGTLSGAATVLSDGTLVQPFLLMREVQDIMKLNGDNPLQRLTIDPNAPLLLPIHSQLNRALETKRGSKRHGSTGLGVGAARDYELTMKENHTEQLVPRVGDMSNPFTLADKMMAQVEWLSDRWNIDFGYTMEQAEKQATDIHLIYADMTANNVEIRPAVAALNDERWTPENVVFEGSQGILLDLRYGFFPHVTYGWLDAGNAVQLCKDSNLPEPIVVGCTRTYSTRHGKGPFPPEDTEDIPEVDNGTGVWQGAFRTGLFDVPMFKYGVELVKPDIISLSCEDLYPGKVIAEWTGEDGASIDPKNYALAADDAIRREDDDSKWDPNTVYAPLLAARPSVRRLDLEDLRKVVSDVSNAPVIIEGKGITLEDWTSNPLDDGFRLNKHEAQSQQNLGVSHHEKTPLVPATIKQDRNND